MSAGAGGPPGGRGPVAHGAVQPYGYTGSDDSVYKANSRQNRLPSKKEEEKKKEEKVNWNNNWPLD